MMKYYINNCTIDSRKYLKVYADTKSKLICAMMPIEDVVIDTLTHQNIFFITFELSSGRLIARVIQEKGIEGRTSTVADGRIFALLFPRKTLKQNKEDVQLIEALNHLIRRSGGRKKSKKMF